MVKENKELSEIERIERINEMVVGDSLSEEEVEKEFIKEFRKGMVKLEIEEVVRGVKKLEEGDTLTKEDILNINKVIRRLTESEENYVDLWQDLSDANQELDNYYQQEIGEDIRKQDEIEQEEKRHFEEINSMYEEY